MIYQNTEGKSRKAEAGFTIVELMITMVAFVFVIAAASQMLTGLMTQFKQQSKIAETNIEGIIGLNILRQDIEHAGYGLPWNGLIAYNEASSAPASNFNDSTTTSPPRAVITDNNVTFFGGGNAIFNGTDYLVIKAVNVATNDTSRKWTTLQAAPFTPLYDPATGYNPRVWDIEAERFVGDDNVIVLTMGATSTTERRLVVDGVNFSTTYANITTAPWPPTDNTENHTVYGVDPDTPLRMPFNRADYYILKFDADGADIVPTRCDNGTGVLVKATLNHDSNGSFTEMPILDCVADIQTTFWLDTDEDGNINWPPSDDISGLTAQQIRDQLKEVRIYIVAHEGQQDRTYDFSMNESRESLSADEGLDGNTRTITFVNLNSLVGSPDYKYYRWKVYTIVVKPENLGS